MCRWCEEEEETMEHVMECEAGLAMRRELVVEGLSNVWERPVQALNYWRWWTRRRLKSM